MAGLDDLDLRLIGLLRDDARLPNATLARHLGVSRGTVQNRIDRLIQSGVLLGFTVRLRGDAGAGAVRAIMSIALGAAEARQVIAALRRMPEVGRIHSTNGRWDLIAELDTPDLAALDRALTAIRALKPVANSETSILLAELK
ncbi:MAG: Lrp/AsnC family transcriptional regulator [Amaricoccus sp.]